MKDRPIEFRTRKGQRVYRRRTYGKNQTEKTYSNNYTLRIRQDSCDTCFNLGVDKRQAASVADEIAAFLLVEGNTIDEALTRYSKKHRDRALKQKKQLEQTVQALGKVTVEMMCEKYVGITSHLSSVTRRNNTHAIRYMAAGIMGLTKLTNSQTKAQQQERRKKTGAFLIERFTNEAVEKFRQRELHAVKDDYKKQGSVTTTMNSYLRAARGIFAKKLLHHYHDLKLPEFIPFHGVRQLPEPSHRYHSKIDINELIKLASAELKESDPQCWIIFLLSIGVGLRRNEIDKLLWEQVDFENRRIWIKTTQYFRPKTKTSEDYVDVGVSVMDELISYKKSIDEDTLFVITGKLASGGKMRCLPTFKRILDWLRAHGVNENNPLHTLRKEAGSMLFKRDGSLHKVAEFLRNDPRIAKEHYVGRMERIELELPEFG